MGFRRLIGWRVVLQLVAPVALPKDVLMGQRAVWRRYGGMKAFSCSQLRSRC